MERTQRFDEINTTEEKWYVICPEQMVTIVVHDAWHRITLKIRKIAVEWKYYTVAILNHESVSVLDDAMTTDNINVKYNNNAIAQSYLCFNFDLSCFSIRNEFN